MRTSENHIRPEPCPQFPDFKTLKFYLCRCSQMVYILAYKQDWYNVKPHTAMG